MQGPDYEWTCHSVSLPVVAARTMVYLTMENKKMGRGKREVKRDKWKEDRNVDGCTVVNVGLDFAVGSE